MFKINVEKRKTLKSKKKLCEYDESEDDESDEEVDDKEKANVIGDYFRRFMSDPVNSDHFVEPDQDFNMDQTLSEEEQEGEETTTPCFTYSYIFQFLAESFNQ